MSKTLLIENRSNLKFLYTINLKLYTDSEVYCTSSMPEALSYIQENGLKIDLVISRNEIEHLPVALEMIRLMERKNLEIPMIVLGKKVGQKVEDRAVVIDETPVLKDLIKMAAQALGVTAKMMASKTVPDYYPFPMDYFKIITVSPCDIFMKPKEDVEDYVIWCIEKNEIPKGNIKGLIKDGYECLYIRAKERLNFVNQYNQILQTFLNKEDIAPEERIEKTDNIYDITSKTLAEIGITEESVQLIQTSVTSIQRVVEQNSTLSKLLSCLLSENYSFRYKHCQIITMVANKIIDCMEWGNKEQREKLSFVAFLHDIILKNDEECKIHNSDQLVAANLAPNDYNRVLNHARLAAQYIKAYPRAPIGADDIVEHHHGDRAGIGFSEEFIRTAPLTAVFVVSEELALRILDAHDVGTHFDWSKNIKEICAKYDRPAFRKVLQTLEQISKSLAL